MESIEGNSAIILSPRDTFEHPWQNKSKTEGRAGNVTYKVNSSPNSKKLTVECRTYMKPLQRQRYKQRTRVKTNMHVFCFSFHGIKNDDTKKMRGDASATHS